MPDRQQVVRLEATELVRLERCPQHAGVLIRSLEPVQLPGPRNPGRPRTEQCWVSGTHT